MAPPIYFIFSTYVFTSKVNGDKNVVQKHICACKADLAFFSWFHLPLPALRGSLMSHPLSQEDTVKSSKETEKNRKEVKKNLRSAAEGRPRICFFIFLTMCHSFLTMFPIFLAPIFRIFLFKMLTRAYHARCDRLNEI